MLGSSFDKPTLRAAIHRTASCHLDHPSRDCVTVGLRLTLASQWYRFGDIDLDEFGDFERFIEQHDHPSDIGYVRGKNLGSPFTAALRTYCEHGRELGFRYNERDIDNYVYWMRLVRAGETDLTPTAFLAQADSRRRAVRSRARAMHAAKKDAGAVVLLEGVDHEVARQDILEGRTTTFELRLKQLAEDTDPDAPLRYLACIRGRGVRSSHALSSFRYPFRMHGYPVETWKVWEHCLDRFIADREARGFEGTVNLKSMKFLIADYLCCYLPWWHELHPEVEANFPLDPSRFERFGWWVSGVDDCENPTPLLDFGARFWVMKASTNHFVALCHKFFEFCRGHAQRLRLSAPGFSNPVIPGIDRAVERRRQKTSKVPINGTVFPYLMRYAYECEEFFIALQRRVLEGTDLSGMLRNGRRAPDRYHPADFGLAPCVRMGDAVYPIDTVPRLAMPGCRLVSGADGPGASVTLPVLTALRLVIAALETGIRFQGLQWLDRRTFDLLNRGRAEESDLWALLVSTDKVKDRPWCTFVVRRVRDLLKREDTFQELMADEAKNLAVPYERRANSRFGEIVPLFRTKEKAVPISDQMYVRAWDLLLVSFQAWYNATVAGRIRGDRLDMYWYEPIVEPGSGKPKIEAEIDGNDEPRVFCPIVRRLLHTPHAARATFISARASVLPVEETQRLVGHGNAAETYYYTVESDADVRQRIVAAGDAIWNGTAADGQKPMHVRSDRVNSALRQSFAKDRMRTEAAFGFSTLSLLNEDVPDADGIALLRSTPMARIAFRETHICPVGEQCPVQVMDAIKEPRRCGLCPLGVKCVDHITAIGAKMRVLLEQTEEAKSAMRRMAEKGEPPETIGQLNERRKLDALEYTAWKTSLLSLTDTLERLKNSAQDLFLVGMPDAVRLHLKLVTKDRDVANFLMERIVDSHLLPIMETASVRVQASQLRWRLLSSAKVVEEEFGTVPEADPVAALLDSLRVALAARGVKPTFAGALLIVRSLMTLPETKSRPQLRKPS